MDTKATGSIYGTRQGSIAVRHTFRVSGSTSTTSTKFIRILASTAQPTIVEAQVVVTTADGGTTPTLNVSETAAGTGTGFFATPPSTATAATGGTFLPASNATGKYVFTADTDLYYLQGGTPNGAGVSTIILDVTTINTSTVTGL